MIRLASQETCTGCAACANICPKSAIEMQMDKEGFLFPFIDEDLCVECGKCLKACPVLNVGSTRNCIEPESYALWSLLDRRCSSSGGAFSAFARMVLNQRGVVYGAELDESLTCKHTNIQDVADLGKLRGSKYVQSDLNTVFRQVRNDLKDGLMVLFSGTPCQTAGLNSFVGRKLRGNLILVDIVCHGVPGPYVWRDYLAYLEKKQGDKICGVNFRDKQKYGWAAHHETFEFVNGKDKVSFTYLFYQNIMFRRSCVKCHYANTKRPSDMTIADYWGWEKTDPEINKDDKGVSLILVNTEKGCEIFENIKDSMTIIPANLEDCLQPNLQHPSEFNARWEGFEDDYRRKGFEYVLKKYNDDSLTQKTRRFVSKCGRIIKKGIGL